MSPRLDRKYTPRAAGGRERAGVRERFHAARLEAVGCSYARGHRPAKIAPAISP
jgi:hypothetical protein